MGNKCILKRKYDSGFVPAGLNDRQTNLTGLNEYVEYTILVYLRWKELDRLLFLLLEQAKRVSGMLPFSI